MLEQLKIIPWSIHCLLATNPPHQVYMCGKCHKLANLCHLVTSRNCPGRQLFNASLSHCKFEAIDDFSHPSSLMESTWTAEANFTLCMTKKDKWQLCELAVVISHKLHNSLSTSNRIISHCCQQFLCLRSVIGWLKHYSLA